VQSLARRGKYILAPLDRDDTLVIHLGMTGRFVVDSGTAAQAPGDFALAAPVNPKHAHIVLETDCGDCITYYDARRFGYMDLLPTAGLGDHPWFAAMGPEPLGDTFSSGHLARAFADRRQGPKTLLLDQRTVAGLGNIYVCEALHRARISPFRPAGEIGPRKRAALWRSIVSVLNEAIAAGGSTLRDYASVEGAMGYFQHDFRVYGREGEPCPTPDCRGTVARTVQSGRSTFHCPVCQA
jgi:formamidopyrimidine-DNA glycosylase